MTDFKPQFWCVWCEQGGSPTVKHHYYEDAKREAVRLARANPGKPFTVLAAASAFVKDEVREIRFDERLINDAEIPF